MKEYKADIVFRFGAKNAKAAREHAERIVNLVENAGEIIGDASFEDTYAYLQHVIEANGK